MIRGKWVAFEGPDGAGKTTLSKKLHEHYPEALYLPSPSCSITGEFARSSLNIRDSGIALEARQLLFLADIVDSYMRFVLPSLASGRMVISDRWIVSTVIYEMALLEWLGDAEVGMSVSSYLLSYYLQNAYGMGPDVTVMVSTPSDYRKKRIAGRHGEDMNERGWSFQKIVSRLYEQSKDAKWYEHGLKLTLTVPGESSGDPDMFNRNVKMLKDDIDRVEVPELPVGPLALRRLNMAGLL